MSDLTITQDLLIKSTIMKPIHSFSQDLIISEVNPIVTFVSENKRSREI